MAVWCLTAAAPIIGGGAQGSDSEARRMKRGREGHSFMFRLFGGLGEVLVLVACLLGQFGPPYVDIPT